MTRGRCFGIMPSRYVAQSGPSPAHTVAEPIQRECLRPFVLRRRLHGGPRDLANVARYDEADLPLDDLNYITDDTMVVFGWLASRAFHVWQQTVLAGSPRATTLQAYNTFPAPRLGKRDRATLEGAARTVLVSRSHLMAGSLADLYADLPEQLAWAHAQLDTAADRLLGIADDADDEQAAAVLVSAFAALAA